MKLSDVTLLIMHYNRSRSLRKSLETMKTKGIEFEAVVVSDDGSRPEHLNALKEMQKEFGFELVTTPVNRGLGHNNNKGQDAVKTPYTLYAQEDFFASTAFPLLIMDAIQIIKEQQNIDMVRLYLAPGLGYPYLAPYFRGFRAMKFHILKPGKDKFFVYSDHPHLRRSNFFQKFGRYKEGIPAIKTEKGMVMSFLQSGGKAVLSETNLFETENTTDEPSTQNYGTYFRLKRMLPDVVFSFLWAVKLTYEYFFVRFKS